MPPCLVSGVKPRTLCELCKQSTKRAVSTAPGFSFLFKITLISCLCVHISRLACTHKCYNMHVEIRGQPWESIPIPSTGWVLGITLSLRLSGECIYPLSHLTNNLKDIASSPQSSLRMSRFIPVLETNTH